MLRLSPPIKDFSFNKSISQLFGMNPALYAQFNIPGHNGLDIFFPGADKYGYGTPILAAHDGKIVRIEYDVPHRTKGNGIELISNDGSFTTIYWHLSAFQCNVGDIVKEGDVIGLAGNSGFVRPIPTLTEPHNGCYDKETEVLTNNGWKKFAVLAAEDTICTLNPNTREIEYQKPTGFISVFSPFLYSYESTAISVAVSPNHRMAIAIKNSNKIERIPIEKIKASHDQIPRKGIWKGQEQEFFNLPPITKLNHITEYKTQPMQLKMDDWLDFLGWYFSDGCFVAKEYNGQKRFQIFITQGYVNSEKIKEIQNCVNKLPFNFHISHGKKSKALSFVAFNKQLTLYLAQFSKDDKKILPSFIENLSSRQISIFLASFAKGDGYQTKNGGMDYYPGVSKLMADQLQILLLKTGQVANIKTKKPFNLGKRNTYFLTTRLSEYGDFQKSKIKKVPYNDYVYCVEVPNHIMYVRRKDKPYFCGNTHLHFGYKPQFKNNEYGGYSDPTPVLFKEGDRLPQKLVLNLMLGSKSDQVSLLQTFLKLEGFAYDYDPIGYFGTKTLRDVRLMQEKRFISPALGFVWNKTREFLNGRYSAY